MRISSGLGERWNGNVDREVMSKPEIMKNVAEKVVKGGTNSEQTEWLEKLDFLTPTLSPRER